MRRTDGVIRVDHARSRNCLEPRDATVVYRIATFLSVKGARCASARYGWYNARAAPLPRRQSPWRLATGTRSSFRRVGIVGSACAAADARARDHARSRALWQSCSGPNARDSPKMWIGAGSESPGLVSFGRYPPRPYSGFPFPLG